MHITDLHNEYIEKRRLLSRIAFHLKDRKDKDSQDALGLIICIAKRGDLLIKKKKKFSTLSEGSRKNKRYKRIRI